MRSIVRRLGVLGLVALLGCQTPTAPKERCQRYVIPYVSPSSPTDTVWSYLSVCR